MRPAPTGLPVAVARGADARRARVLFDGLPRREREVAELVAAGLSNQEIAARLFIEPAAVRRTVSRILARMRMRDRVQIVIAWYRSGLWSGALRADRRADRP